MFSCEICKIFKSSAAVSDKFQIQLKKNICCHKKQHLGAEDNSWIFLYFYFSILRFFEFCYNELVLLKVWVWYRCQKWIERYYHHAGEQLTFYQKVHVKTHSLRKGECFCNLCIAVSSNLFDKDRTQYNVKWHIQQEGSWLSWIVTEQVKCK